MIASKAGNPAVFDLATYKVMVECTSRPSISSSVRGRRRLSCSVKGRAIKATLL